MTARHYDKSAIFGPDVSKVGQGFDKVAVEEAVMRVAGVGHVSAAMESGEFLFPEKDWCE